MKLTEQLLQHKIVAIFRGIEQQPATLAADAFIRGGVRFIEVTMNTVDAEQILRHWSERYEQKAFVGAGTVIDLATAKRAIDAGAKFLISPNFDREVLEYAHIRNIAVWPGVTTPTEMMQAWRAGAKIVKLFPLASLGIAYLREVKAPLGQIPIMATGGVTLENVTEYIQAGADALGIGSQLVNKQWIEAGQWDELEQRAARFVRAVHASKSS